MLLSVINAYDHLIMGWKSDFCQLLVYQMVLVGYNSRLNDVPKFGDPSVLHQDDVVFEH